MNYIDTYMTKKTIPTIGYASGIAANDPNCGYGPLVLKKSRFLRKLPLKWEKILRCTKNVAGLDTIPYVATLCRQLAKLTYQLSKRGKKFLVVGGDHTSAIGTWSGVAESLPKNKNLGLIWIDAHMDSHTVQNTQSNNVHGMPLACLLGYCPSKLSNIGKRYPKLLPQNICLIGVRSYEASEAALLKKLRVKIFFMKDVKKLGIKKVITQAIKKMNKNTECYGISLDLDALDPVDIPGVGLPESDGICAQKLLAALKSIDLTRKFCGAEIVEFNPKNDQKQKTEKYIAEIINTLYK